MTIGTVGEARIRKIINEDRRTYYKLHPNQEKYPGAIIEMPNLPNDKYHWDMWMQKGYQADMKSLMPGKEIVWDANWGCNKFITNESIEMKRVCDICGQECIGDFGLQAHKRKHEKENPPKAV